MRLDFVKIFIDSTTMLFGQLIGSDVDVSSIRMNPVPDAGRDVMAIICLTGDIQGRVIIDMDLFTAVHLAGCMVGESSPGMTPLVRSTIAELASIAIGHAISKINDKGTRVGMSPPTVISGSNLVSYDQSFETLVAPIRTAYGEVCVNVTMQDLN